MLLASCNGGGPSGGGGGVVPTTAPSAPSGLARLNPSTLNGSDSTPELTISGVVNGNTVKVFTDSNCSTEEVGSGVAFGASVNITTSALALGSYTFYANSANTYGTSSCSATSVSYNYGAVPSAPTSLSLVTPSSSPGLDSTPTISVGGVVNGNTVRLFSDSACTTTEIGSAASLGTSVDITVSSALSVSSHTIYANASNAFGTSSCSSLSASYTLASCPANFIPVPHNSSVATTKDFCVMKYEAKDNGGVAVSLAAGNPYVSLTSGDSQTKCTDLGANYDLISNPERMTIARNAETVSSNWSTGSVGYGEMARGWVASFSYGDTWTNTTVAPSTGLGCLYNIGSNTCGSSGDFTYRRTLALSNGEEIWDLSGNVREWVDWSYTTPGFQKGPTTCAGGWVEFYPNAASYECFSGLENQVFPATPGADSSEGVGRFHGGTGGAAHYGGFWGEGQLYAGAFTLSLNSSTTGEWISSSIGFRCVYRP